MNRFRKLSAASLNAERNRLILILDGENHNMLELASLCRVEAELYRRGYSFSSFGDFLSGGKRK